MKKILINSLICSALMASPAFANTEKMFENTQSKEWNSTPKNVREALTNIKVMSGSSAKDMMSTNWLNELKRSPGTYGLNSSDVEWVNGMLSANNGKSTWNTKTKVKTTNKKAENVAIAKNASPKKETVNKSTEKDIFIAKEAVNKESKKTSAISTPLPASPKDFAAVKSQDLTPVREQDKTENNIAKINSKPVSKPVQKAEIKDTKEAVSVDHNLLKISDALISVYNNEKVENINNDLATLKIIEETIRVEELNRMTIKEQNEKLNQIEELLNEYKLSDDINNELIGVEKLTEIVKTSNEDAERINDKLEMKNEDLINKEKEESVANKKAEEEVINTIDETTSSAISISKLTYDLEKKNTENAEKMIKEVTNSIGKSVIENKNTSTGYWKEKLLVILSGFFFVLGGVFPFISKKGKK